MSVEFGAVTVGGATRDNSAGAAYARRVGVDVYPVDAKYTVILSNNSGTKHAYEYESKGYWYIDNRGECSLDFTSGAGFKRQLY